MEVETTKGAPYEAEFPPIVVSGPSNMRKGPPLFCFPHRTQFTGSTDKNLPTTGEYRRTPISATSPSASAER